MSVVGALLLAVAASPEPLPEAPLSAEELALLDALTATAASEPEPVAREEGPTWRWSLARTAAEALDHAPSLFRTLRGRDQLTVWRDGVPLPTTHGFGRLQDGWLMLDPHAVDEVRWTAEPSNALGQAVHLDGPRGPDEGWQARVTTIARTADRSLGARGRLGYGHGGRTIVAGGRFDTLPSLRLQSADGPVTGDRLGQQWSAFLRARQGSALTVGADWQRRWDASIAGPRPQEQVRIDHGLAFVRGRWANGDAVVAYVRDDFVDDAPRASHRALARVQAAWRPSERWQLSAGGRAQLAGQTSPAGDGMIQRAEPWLEAEYTHGRWRLSVQGRFLWGRVNVDEVALTAAEPIVRLEVDGPFAAGFGWRIAGQRGAYLPQTWHLPAASPASPETSWTLEGGPTWTSARGTARVTGFIQRIDAYWPRMALPRTDLRGANLDVRGIEAAFDVRLWRHLTLAAAAGWADDQLRNDVITSIRPASARFRGTATLRYKFEQRGFVAAHARWLTAPLSDDERPEGDSLDAPLRLGLSGGVALGKALMLTLVVQNALDANYDDPLIDRDQVGVDARLALTYALDATGARP